ncbi:MAG: protein phosphatase 2C domain-containing protein [Janthinobacterium lividum]
MKIYSALQIGDYHLNHCEDYLFVGEIGENKLLCAVMDGCTTATDSYLISTLVGKLLRKIAKEKGYQELYGLDVPADLDGYLQTIVQQLFAELNVVKNQLLLEPKELLTTLIILLVDAQQNQGIVLVIGDGLVSINGHITEFDQDNKPDYLGFHLNKEFAAWYARQEQKILFDEVQDVSIATDGIFMFTPVRKVAAPGLIDPVEFLVMDRTHAETPEMLTMKLKKLEHSYGLKPSDDFAMIRLLA